MRQDGGSETNLNFGQGGRSRKNFLTQVYGRKKGTFEKDSGNSRIGVRSNLNPKEERRETGGTGVTYEDDDVNIDVILRVN